MKEWEIKVLYLGNISANLSFVWPPLNPQLETDPVVKAPYLGFLLKSGDRAILVDTGINEKFIVDGKAWGMLPAEGGESFLTAALEKEGVSPEQIDTVLITHLHNDHAGNCHLFPNARFVFQRDEWQNLLTPYPHQLLRNDYDPAVIDVLKELKFCLINGDMDIDSGLRVCKMPGGHTLGHQVISVNTAKGTVVLMGDICLFNFLAFPNTTEMMTMEGETISIPPGSPAYGSAIPHTLIYDAFSFYDAVSAMRAIARKDAPTFMIPGHEPSLLVTGI